MRRTVSISLICLALVAVCLPMTGLAAAADIILNEYNAVDGDLKLDNDAVDPFWGRRDGNGGDWFELVVITDHLNVEGWELVVVNDVGQAIDAENPVGEETFSLSLTNADVWTDLRSGTIVTFSEGLGSDVGELQPEIGKWWLNVRANSGSSGTYVTVSCVAPACAPGTANWKVSNKNWQLTIKDDMGAVVYGPAGEGITPATGIGSTEVFKLEVDPSGAVTPNSNYADGTSSTFGQPNRYAAGTATQNFAGLRSVVPYSALTDVRVNEVLSHSDPGLDWVELVNTSDVPVDIGGWFLSDRFSDLLLYAIPAPTVLEPGEYWTIDQDLLSFGFSSACGDQVILSMGNGVVVNGPRDVLEFGPIETGRTFGRFPDGTGEGVRMREATKGARNLLPEVGPIVINEVMYHPPTPLPVLSISPEYIELHNIGDSVATLSTDYGALGVHPWRLTGGADFDFLVGQEIPGDDFLLIVPFDPVTETAKADEFRTLYNLSPSIPLTGPYSGGLDNFSEAIRLRMPDTPEIDGDICGGTGNPSPFVPYVRIDSLTYFDFGEWPESADGDGPSLERTAPHTPGESASSWAAASPPTPGGTNSTVTFPTRGQQKCLTKMNKEFAKAVKNYGSDANRCLKDQALARLTPMTVDECLVADRRGKLAKSASKLARIDESTCVGSDSAGIPLRPYFGTTDTLTVTSAVPLLGQGLYRDALGLDLNGAVVARGDNSSASRCQLKVAGDLQKCVDAGLKSFVNCKKKALREESIGSIGGIAACVGDDPSSKVAKVCDPVTGKLRKRLDKSCAEEGVDLATALGGCGLGGDAASTASCLNTSVRCRSCRSLDLADALYIDCDLFDDAVANLSCP